MKPIRFLSAIITTCMAFDASAYVKQGNPQEYEVAHSGQYISGHFVLSPYYYLSEQGETYDIGTPVGATFALGVNYDRFRTELELKYLTGAKLKNDYVVDVGINQYFVTETIKFNNLYVMLNGYYDIYLTDALGLFAGFGLGYLHSMISMDAVAEDAYHNRTFLDDDITRDAFAYQFILGVTHDISENVLFDLQYRFTGTNKIEGANICGHEFLIGARFTF